MRLQILVPKNTAIASPVTITTQFMQGPIISVEEIFVPDGHAFLTGLQMRTGHANGIVIPERGSTTEWLVDNGRTIRKGIRIVLDPPQYAVEFRAYNLDDTYPHTFYIDLE